MNFYIRFNNQKRKNSGIVKKTRHGKMLRSGDVVRVQIQFTDTFEIKKRPALVLFEEFDNVIVAGVTSNFTDGRNSTLKRGRSSKRNYH